MGTRPGRYYYFDGVSIYGSLRTLIDGQHAMLNCNAANEGDLLLLWQRPILAIVKIVRILTAAICNILQKRRYLWITKTLCVEKVKLGA